MWLAVSVALVDMMHHQKQATNIWMAITNFFLLIIGFLFVAR